MSVKTTQVTGRRKLHFESHQEILQDARKLASGPSRQLGNWSLGEICQHLAKTLDMSIDGTQATFPWYLRVLAPLLKKRFLSHPMRAGFKIPSGVAVVPDRRETEAGVAALEKAIARMQNTSARKPHPLFGKLTREEWDQLHMRHGELHLSFVVPE